MKKGKLNYFNSRFPYGNYCQGLRGNRNVSGDILS